MTLPSLPLAAARPAIRARRAALALAVGVTVALSGCQAMRGDDGGFNRTSKGAGIGAVGGAALGAIAGGRKGALIGAGIGALSGGAVGKYMDRQQATLDKELANSGVTVSREGDNLRLNMPGSLTFATNADQVQPQFHPVLDDISKVLGDYDKTLVDVVGFTDSTGAAAYNEALSRRRAQSVASYMGQRGLMDARVVTNGRGQSDPVATNATATGRERNRRVEILLTPLTE